MTQQPSAPSEQERQAREAIQRLVGRDYEPTLSTAIDAYRLAVRRAAFAEAVAKVEAFLVVNPSEGDELCAAIENDTVRRIITALRGLSPEGGV